MNSPWETKAHELVASYALASWKQNKKRAGYRLPAIANALVKALGMHDAKEREHEIKRLCEVERLGAWTLV
jgi:hypothetical protein